MSSIVGVFAVTDHYQECDRVQRCGHPEELIFWVAVNCHLKRRGGLGREERRGVRGSGGARRKHTHTPNSFEND